VAVCSPGMGLYVGFPVRGTDSQMGRWSLCFGLRNDDPDLEAKRQKIFASVDDLSVGSRRRTGGVRMPGVVRILSETWHDGAM
jgi:hypothetical protein